MRKVSLIVYDFDGTLVDTLYDIADSVNLTLADLSLSQLSRETIQKYVGKGVERLMSQTLNGTGFTDITRAAQSYICVHIFHFSHLVFSDDFVLLIGGVHGHCAGY